MSSVRSVLILILKVSRIRLFELLSLFGGDDLAWRFSMEASTIMLLRRINNNSFWNSIQDIDQLRHQLNQLLSLESPTSATGGLSAYPPLNTWLSEDGAIVTAEIPGVAADALEISVVNDTLTIKGSRSEDMQLQKNGEACHRQERGFGTFSRTVQLPFAVESEKVEARCQRGILEIRLPRKESEKARKVTVKSS